LLCDRDTLVGASLSEINEKHIVTSELFRRLIKHIMVFSSLPVSVNSKKKYVCAWFWGLVEPLLYSTRKPRNGQQRVSLRQCEHLVCAALFRRLAISPLRRAFPTTPPSSSPHHIALSWTRASHPPLSLPPRAASAPFFASHPPLLRTPCMSRCTHVLLLPSMCSLIYCGTFIDVEEDRAPFSVGVKMRTDDW